MTVHDNNLLGGFQIINTENPGGADAAEDQITYENYFGFQETKKYFLPDGKQWIAFRPLNEGERAKYERATQKDVSFNRKSDEAKIKIDASNDRWTLIKDSVTDWFMVQPDQSGGWNKVMFSNAGGGVFDQWLAKANPKIVNELHLEIQRANSWMTADLTAEAIKEEIVRLEELLAETEKRDAQGKNS